jgi:SAM-dependent methyltransferase
MTDKYEVLEPLFADLPRGGAVDIGCGYGQSLRVLAGLGFDPLYGYDLVPTCIDAARAGLQQFGKTVHLYAKDATHLEDIDSSSVTLICSRGALHYFNSAKVAKSVNRVLKPGGYAVVELNGLHYYLWPKHLNKLTTWQLARRLPVYGSVVVRTAIFELTAYQPLLGAKTPEIGWTKHSIARFAEWAGLEVVQLSPAPTLRGYLVVMRKPV